MNNFAIEAEKEAEHVAFEAEKSHNLDTASSSTPSSSDANIPSAPASNTYIPQSEKSDNVTNEKGQQPTKKPRRSFFSRKNKQGKEVAVEAEQDPLAHLPDHEAEILRRQIVVPPVEVGYKTLFRYSTRNDKLFMALGAVCAIIGGAVNPLMTVVFGSLAGTFQGYFLGTISKAQFDHDLGMFTLYFVYIAIAEFVAIYVATVTFIYTGEHMTRKIREQYLAAILRQNIGFFDKLGAGEITTRITADTNLIQEALSEKIGLTLTGLATFVTAFVIGFVESWRLTLILTSIVFAIVFSMGGFSKYIVLYNKLALDSYAEGGTVAEEVLSSIRNATAFSTQDKLSKQYDVYLKRAEYYGLRFKSILGVMIGVMMFIVYCNYALAFWQGSRYLVAGTDNVTLAKILTILLSMMIGAFQLGVRTHPLRFSLDIG
jgi:ATP-binding cassette subfamily B (MDR/TAP) protein 1